MRHKPGRIAAAATLVVVVVGALSLSTGSVAFSQVRHAANSTLSWLKSMLVGDTSDEPAALPPEPVETRGGTADRGRRTISCTARFFDAAQGGQDIQRFLEDEGIEFVEASAEPRVQYAILSRQEADSFDVPATVRCIASPHVMVLAGETAGLTDTGKPGGLALGWLPTVSSDGKEVLSTISFHDGQAGFELPALGTESGGAVLILADGMFPDREVLVQVQVEIQ
ncbi:MAG: hypothetical protein KBE65_09560 [Phycisphaerae bacterium]|nr:hypothetical protein [Phycisphaerae bacterium]